jgi:hypothetical protein
MIMMAGTMHAHTDTVGWRLYTMYSLCLFEKMAKHIPLGSLGINTRTAIEVTSGVCLINYKSHAVSRNVKNKPRINTA